MIPSTRAKISEFFSICINLMQESGRIIQSVHQSKSFEKQMKGIDDPVTQADIHVQTLIAAGLRHYYPDISIVGEEETEYEPDLAYDFEKRINRSLIPEAIYQKIGNDFDLKDTTVWIDPLDGTLSYLDNELDAVTTLIGISYKERPIIGIIAHYYQPIEEKSFLYKPCFYFGHKDLKQVHYIYESDLIKENVIPWELKLGSLEGEKAFRVVCTKNRKDAKLEGRIKDIGGELQMMGGCGKKILQVILGKSDCYFYDRTGTKKWDTCAGEALLEALGGVITGMNGDYYEYKVGGELANKNGVLAMINKKKHSEIIEITKKFEV